MAGLQLVTPDLQTSSKWICQRAHVDELRLFSTHGSTLKTLQAPDAVQTMTLRDTRSLCVHQNLCTNKQAIAHITKKAALKAA